MAIASPLPAADTGGVVAVAPQTTTERNRQRVDAAFRGWAAGGSGFFTGMLAPDVVWTIAGSSPSAGTYRGIEDFLANAVQPFVGRLRTPVRPTSWRIWADGDHVIIDWAGAAVARDGRPYRNRYAWIFRMQDGRAVEVTAFLDMAAYDDVLARIPAMDAEGR